MSLKILPANGMITIPAGAAALGVDFTPTTADVLADNSDATYVYGDPSPYAFNAQLEALTSYDSGDPITLHIRLSLESDDHTGTDSSIYIFLQDGHPTDDTGTYYVGQFTVGSWNTAAAFPPPFDGTIHELALPLVVAPGHTLADCVTVLESGNAQVAVNTLTILDGPFTQANIRTYEAWVTVGAQVLAPAPLRLYPRSQTRLYPRRRTRRPGTF